MANTNRDRRPELMPFKVDGGWIIQALAHNGDSAWFETKTPAPYAATLGAILGMAATGEYAVYEPRSN